MDKPHPLSTIFAGCAGDPGSRAVAADELERALADLWREGRAAWPGVDLAAEALAQHLGERWSAGGAGGEEPLQGLSAVSAADVYIACACLRLAPGALEAFERSYLSHMPAFLGRMAAGPAFVDEVKQALRERLFVAKEGEAPKIAGYSGRGSLLTWTRVAAVRTALNLRRGRGKQAEGDEAAMRSLAAGGDAELDYIKSRYQEEFRRAIKDAFASLTSKQRNVLRLHFIGGLTGEKIGELFRVHQTTVARWLATSRDEVLSKTKELLQERLKLREEELNSLVIVLRSQLDMSVTILLQETQA